MHKRMLYTIFKRLTEDNTFYPPEICQETPSTPEKFIVRIENMRSEDTQGFEDIDWRLIGFQTKNNPSTDIRGPNMFGILNLVFLTQYYPAFGNTLYKFSQINDFPFVLVALDMSKIRILYIISLLVLKCMRSGSLNTEIRNYQKVTQICHIFYVGVFAEWIQRYIKLAIGIMGYRDAFDQTLQFSLSHSRTIIMVFSTYIYIYIYRMFLRTNMNISIDYE